MDGFLNFNKPLGFTSHDCVAKVRRLLKMKRVGHGGTLDPAATGVLPIALGRATRLLQYLPSEKAYRGTVRFGLKTTTDDLQGETLVQTPASHLTLEQVKACLPQFFGQIQQIPPQYSAIQVGGKRLYDLARAGEVVEVPVRTVQIQEIQVLDWRPGEFPEIDLFIACGSGTYIRSIARDLGDLLQTGGTLAALQRTLSSGLTLKDSLDLETLESQLQHQTFQPLSPKVALSHLPQLTLPASVAKAWCQGQRISRSVLESWEMEQHYCVSDPTGQFLGIGRAQEGEQLAPVMVFSQPSAQSVSEN